MLDSFRHFLRWRLGLAPAETQTSTAERAAIARHARGKASCVEIGVWHGVNTRNIREVMAATAVLTGVDPFPPGRLGFSFPMIIAKHECARSRRGTFRLLRCTSAEAAARWTAPIDFLFVDGDHSYEALRADWEGWSPHLLPGGIACLHDSRPTAARPIHAAGSVRFTDEVILKDPRFEVLESVETLLVLRRRGPAAGASGGG